MLIGKFRGYRSQVIAWGGEEPRKGNIAPRREASASEHGAIYAYRDTIALRTVGINLADGWGPP